MRTNLNSQQSRIEPISQHVKKMSKTDQKGKAKKKRAARPKFHSGRDAQRKQEMKKLMTRVRTRGESSIEPKGNTRSSRQGAQILLTELRGNFKVQLKSAGDTVVTRRNAVLRGRNERLEVSFEPGGLVFSIKIRVDSWREAEEMFKDGTLVFKITKGSEQLIVIGLDKSHCGALTGALPQG